MLGKKAYHKTFAIVSKYFSEIVPKKSEMIQTNLNTLEIMSEPSKKEFNITLKELQESKVLGVDIFLTPEKQKIIKNNSFFFKDNNSGIDLDKVSHNGFKLGYLKNMNLLDEYNTIFREFLQSCALYEEKGLNLTCENRFNDCVKDNLNSIKKLGYQLEIDSLSTQFNYSVLRLELYKNLSINRYENDNFTKYTFSNFLSPIAPLIIARKEGEDISFAKYPKPFILAATMRIRTPMKICILNQNMSRKIYGEKENEVIDYVVRFETQLSYSDFSWILPTPNKPSRLRSTKITDFNNLMRGNPYFLRKWDLIDENVRFNYMTKDNLADEIVYSRISYLNKLH